LREIKARLGVVAQALGMSFLATRVFLFSGVLLFAGCGYPTDPDKWMPDFGIQGEHGAIALNEADMVGAITARYLSQEEADSQALLLCGRGCEIVLRFEGAGQCGALASSANKHWGVGSGNSLLAATTAAMDQCSSSGGAECVVELQGCNE
jgi:hypothetical protein